MGIHRPVQDLTDTDETGRYQTNPTVSKPLRKYPAQRAMAILHSDWYIYIYIYTRYDLKYMYQCEEKKTESWKIDMKTESKVEEEEGNSAG